MQAADDEEPIYDRVANLSYTPKFEYAYLLERERRCRFPALYWTVLIGAELMFVWLMFSTGRWGYAVSLLAAMAPSVYFSRFDLYEYWCICRQILDYWTASTRPLPECTDHPVAIDWWSLVKSGFTPGKTGDYVHSELGLRGKPWRLLKDEQSRQRLPAIKHKAFFGNRVAVTPSYRLHLAACAVLIEYQEGATVDWGVVVDSRTLTGYAVPITAQEKGWAVERLREYQKLVSDGHRFPKENPPAGACRFCELAYPRLEDTATKLGEQSLTPHLYNLADVLPTLDNKQLAEQIPELKGAGEIGATHILGEFRVWVSGWKKPPNRHSTCGDVFVWQPPHTFWESQWLKAYRKFKTRFHR